MTLTVDHRVFYGATAAQFMAEVKTADREPRHSRRPGVTPAEIADVLESSVAPSPAH